MSIHLLHLRPKILQFFSKFIEELFAEKSVLTCFFSTRAVASCVCLPRTDCLPPNNEQKHKIAIMKLQMKKNCCTLLYAFVQIWSQKYICIDWFRLIITDNFVLFFYLATMDLIYIQYSNINMVKLLSQISCPTKQYPEKYSIPMCYRLSDYPGCELCLSLLSSQRHHLNGFKAQNLIYAYQQIFCQ